jgi:hypothetical protein
VLVILLTLGVLAAGCGSSNGEEALGAGSEVPTTTTTRADVAATQAASTEGPSDDSEVWDLLYVQDSHGFGVAELLGEHLEDALGVKVELHDKAIGHLAAVTVLKRIRGESPDDWSGLVRDAEVIVLFGNPEGSGITSDIRTCISGSTRDRESPVRYAEEDWQPYRDVLDQIYAEIWRIRSGEPVVLRAVDFINPAISAWREAGIEPECTAALEAMNRTIRAAAEANAATVVSTYNVFNGVNHDEDPREKGWIGSDGIHLNEAGMKAIADAIAAAGFEPTAAP